MTSKFLQALPSPGTHGVHTDVCPNAAQVPFIQVTSLSWLKAALHTSTLCRSQRWKEIKLLSTPSNHGNGITSMTSHHWPTVHVKKSPWPTPKEEVLPLYFSLWFWHYLELQVELRFPTPTPPSSQDMLSLRKNALVNIVFCFNLLIIAEFGLGECFIIMAVNRKVSNCQIT